MRIAVTGHMDVSPDSVKLIRDEVSARLEKLESHGSVTGISCLARGADTIFAEAILDYGGALEVVLPSPHYREKKVKPDHARAFDALIANATRVHALQYTEVNKEAYEAANDVLMTECDRLFAIWDGQAGNRSGTASVVEQARLRGLPVTIIWPQGAVRGR